MALDGKHLKTIERVNELIDLKINHNYTQRDLLSHVMGKWGLSKTMGYELTQKMKKEISEMYKIDMENDYAESISKLEERVKELSDDKSYKSIQLQLDYLKEINKLKSLYSTNVKLEADKDIIINIIKPNED